jgi:transposase InsO family protein
MAEEQDSAASRPARDWALHEKPAYTVAEIIRHWCELPDDFDLMTDPKSGLPLDHPEHPLIKVRTDLVIDAIKGKSKQSGGLLRQRVELRYRFIETEKANFTVVDVCRVIRVSRSGDDAWCRREPDPDRVRRIALVREIHQHKRGRYGRRRMAKELQRRGEPVGRAQARSLMRAAGVAARQRRRWCATTDSDHGDPVAPDRLQRRVLVPAPNRFWVADITAVWTLQGWLYRAAILDLDDRQVVGWAMADHLRTDLVLAALDMAVGRRRPAPGLVHHSDRGSQYASQAYRKTREQHQMEASMSRKGNGWDHAVMERFFGSLKSAWLADQRDLNRDQARQDIVQYTEMHYNSNRLPLCYSCSNP